MCSLCACVWRWWEAGADTSTQTEMGTKDCTPAPARPPESAPLAEWHGVSCLHCVAVNVVRYRQMVLFHLLPSSLFTFLLCSRTSVNLEQNHVFSCLSSFLCQL